VLKQEKNLKNKTCYVSYSLVTVASGSLVEQADEKRLSNPL